MMTMSFGLRSRSGQSRTKPDELRTTTGVDELTDGFVNKVVLEGDGMHAVVLDMAPVLLLELEFCEG